jgi:MAM domain, meprin/A5/mu
VPATDAVLVSTKLNFFFISAIFIFFHLKYFLFFAQRAGDRAFFMSSEVRGSAKATCVSFWYYMFEPIVDNTGPNLGKLAVWVRTYDK